jgi:small subunit ribosomal protein S20
MANIKSAKKRIRVIDKKTARNIRVKRHMKEAEKNFLSAVASGNVDEATKTFVALEKELKQAVAKHTIHKNAASRKISRMAARLNALKAN